ncbi:hypothetical protein [Candidatus Chloroploca sp. Khr17]|uniref:hypothetical protein n=1 Tax=Candidatus Chloroploca sp. Khr17 TaxID=2496869 RepID=UPI00101E1AA6|nr:hypothetical protein [Candidatus Chloroploca sp. Khr17]
MITWNYRVFREDDGDYIVREVFYDEKGAIIGCTAHAVEPIGRSIEDLAEDIRSFQDALNLPILALADMPPTPKERAPRDRSQNRSLEAVLQELQQGVIPPKKRNSA